MNIKKMKQNKLEEKKDTYLSEFGNINIYTYVEWKKPQSER